MRYGHIETSIGKVLLFGIAGSGKTSATAILMGEDPPSIRMSTPLMARLVQVITVLINKLTKWEKKTPEEVQRIIAEIIRSRESSSEIRELQQIPDLSESNQRKDTHLCPHNHHKKHTTSQNLPNLSKSIQRKASHQSPSQDLILP